MSARGNGGRYEYYACSGRQKHGPKACRSERLPRQKLEAAVLRQLAELYRDGELIAEALAKAEQDAARSRPEIEQRLASIGAEITRAEQALERYYEAFEQGKLSPERCDERLSRLQARLEDLRAQQDELSLSTAHEAGHGPTPADLAAVADQLDGVIAEGEPQKTKALLRLLIQELRVDGRAQIQPTYRLVTPTVCATSEKVERTGIEPVTSGLQSAPGGSPSAAGSRRSRMESGNRARPGDVELPRVAESGFHPVSMFTDRFRDCSRRSLRCGWGLWRRQLGDQLVYQRSEAIRRFRPLGGLRHPIYDV